MNDFNCILCKYHNDKNKCYEKIYSSTWNCPTLSNIYYGKLIKWFPFNFYQKIKDEINNKKREKYYNTFNEDYTENEDFKFIFGIISYDDLTSNKPNLLTMNDFDIIYDKNNKKYIMSIETIYVFKNGVDGEREYLNNILNKFTQWMLENNYNIERNVFYEIFTNGNNINTEFDSIETLYATFNCFVKGYGSTILRKE